VLYETARFPITRQSITLRSTHGSFQDVAAKDLKLMGDDYPYYTQDGGVRTYVMEATAKQDWLSADYYAPRILYWVDQEYFYPLRTEIYGPEGEILQRQHRFELGPQSSPPQPDQGATCGLNLGNVTSSLTVSNQTSTGMPTRSSSGATPVTHVVSRGPSSSSTTTAAYGTSSANAGSSA
jgi:hypothetical protein